MKKNEDNGELNKFEKQLEDIKEWQKNQNNPGYYVGSGKVPLPLKNLFKSPIVMIIVGSLLFIPTIYSLFSSSIIHTILNNTVMTVVGIAFISGGIIRLSGKHS